MAEPIYEDDQCWYHGGDPRLESCGAAIVSILDDAIHIAVRRKLHDHEAFFTSLARDGVTDVTEMLARASKADEKAKHEEDRLCWPRRSVLAVRLDEHSMMDLSGLDAHAVADIEMSDEYQSSFCPGVNIQMRDPAGIYSEGFQIALTFRDDSFARVFEKRVREAYALAS